MPGAGDAVLGVAAMESRPEGREHIVVLDTNETLMLPQWSPGPKAGSTRHPRGGPGRTQPAAMESRPEGREHSIP